MMHFVELATKNVESLNNKMARLKRKMVDLESREEDVNTELSYAESLLMKKRRRAVANWLASVEAMKEQVQQLEQQVEEARVWSNFGPLPKVIDRTTEEVKELIQEGAFSGGLTFEAQDSQGFLFPTIEVVGQKFEESKKMIRECLSDDNILSVGIYGMGGVGKTTLVMHIRNELLTFPNTSVFWVTVSQNFSIHKLQNDVARVLGADLKATDDERIRAAILAEALGRRNNSVLILDDLWNAFPLESVGIVSGVRCKLIITTRSMDVCRRMNCHMEITVDPLSKEEAWMLFVKKLGAGTTLTPKIEEIAKSLAKECAGLPLAIITVAGSMRGVDDIHEWNNALETMRQSIGGQDENMQLNEVFRVLRYSFDALKESELQECFLYCSLFPEDEQILREELIAYFIDEGLIKRMRSRHAEFDRGHTILNKLQRACLLQSGTNHFKMKYVKMHDLVRDMALCIASENSRFLVKAGVKYVDVADEEEWSDGLQRVSYINSDISDIHFRASPRCPRLSTLLLSGCRNITAISSSFFKHMKGLTVLDLSYTEIEHLPSSISNLNGLSALLLKGCRQIKMPFDISDLIALKRLDLSDSGITELPHGMEMLIHLRDLNLSSAKSLQMISEGILSKLTNLQCLVLSTSYRCGAQVRGEEIASLRKLETFKGTFYDLNELDIYLRSWEEDRPNEYLLLVGDGHWFHFANSEVEKGVSIRDCHNLVKLCDFKSLRNASDLRRCDVDGCHGMTHLFCQDCYDLPFAQSLQSLHLGYLSSLCDLILRRATGVLRLPGGTFSSLKEFRISNCPKIKKLLTPALLFHLGNLEKLDVNSCEQLEEIVGNDDLEEEATASTIIFTTFPKLKTITLADLPELNSFCSSRKMVSDSLEDVYVTKCPKLRRFPLHPPDSLRKIKADEEWWKSVEFDNPNTKDILRPFCYFSQHRNF